jgi:hypothetical protein
VPQREAEPAHYGVKSAFDSKPGSNFAFANRLVLARVWIGIQNGNSGLRGSPDDTPPEEVSEDERRPLMSPNFYPLVTNRNC